MFDRNSLVIPTCFLPDASIGANAHTIKHKTHCELKSMWGPACEKVQLSKNVLNVIKLVKHFFFRLPVTDYTFFVECHTDNLKQ